MFCTAATHADLLTFFFHLIAAINPDNTYEIKVDNGVVATGDLLTSFRYFHWIVLFDVQMVIFL